MGYLVAISIGPVQDFIAAARKTRDLWYGSTMLSDLSRHVAGVLRDAGAELIFPHPDALGSEDDAPLSVANKLLAILPDGDPRPIALRVREDAETWLVGQYAEALRRLGDARPFVDEEIASRQIKHFLEFYSAWVPFDPNQDDYREKRERVERLLAGRKALRDFGKADGKASVPKSSLDPSRESVLQTATPEARETLRRRLNLAYRTRPDAGDITLSEFLDGISIIKRIGGADGGRARYPSVVRVAADPYIRQLVDTCPAALARLNEFAREAQHLGFIERFQDGPHTAGYMDFPYDSQILFADDPDIPDDDPDGARIKAEIRKLVRDHAPAYYAVLVADGDRMGQHLGTMETANEHREFSRKLARFAVNAGTIVREHQGVLVYSGGDDVLAFLPVDRALTCAGRLQREFRTIVSEAVTLSAGISICYYRDPLWLALERGRAAEQAAKKPRNALAVVWHTRSGGDEAPAIVHTWDVNPVEGWDTWIRRFADERIPAGAAYELRNLVRELKPLFEHDRLPDGAGDLVQSEVRRILKRKRTEGGAMNIPDDLIGEIASLCSDPEALEELVNQMIVARRFAAIVRPTPEEAVTS